MRRDRVAFPDGRLGPSRCTAFTLLEMIVTLAILGVMLGMTGLTFTALRVPPSSAWVRALRLARTEAIHAGHPVRARIPGHDPHERSASPAPLFLPDGRALGRWVDPLTGAPIDSLR